jgi:rare lipoprotein A
MGRSHDGFGWRGSAPSAPLIRLALAGAICLVLANCTVGPLSRMVDPRYGVAASPRVIEEGQPVPKGGGVYRLGEAYTIAGRVYTPAVDPQYREEGIASWYGRDFHGRRTANGEIFDMDAISAAHPTLPIPSYVRVTHLGNRRSIVVRVNDRGPFKDDRLIDLSKKSAELLGFGNNGLGRVRVEYVGPASLDGSDDRRLLATLRQDGSPAPAPSSVMVASVGGPFVQAASGPLPARRTTLVPSPQHRPFDLGVPHAPQRVPPQVATTATYEPAGAAPAAARRPQPPVVPVSIRSPGIVSGRGLY